MTETTPNLREKFAQACLHKSMREQRERNLEKGQNGTEQDFYNRFDEIANGLKAGLEALIKEIENGKSVITSPSEAYKHSGEPLKYEIVLPASLSALQQEDIETKGVYYIPGYRKIHEICSSKEIDMNVTTGTRFSGYRTSTGETKGYHSITIEIEPEYSYAAQKDYKPLPSNRSKGNAGPK